MKKLAYNKDNFKELQEKNYLYVDKTKFIEIISEDQMDITDGLFLRPRRFGKSLFISMLYYYYDINHKEELNNLFKNTYIGGNPTKEANGYYVLRFNFSSVDASDKTKLLENFNIHVKNMIIDFKHRYNFDFEIDFNSSASSNLETLLTLVNLKVGKKVIILVDEYDHFTNDILSDKDYFDDITGKEGFVRSFYTVIKAQRGIGCIAKVILTGVSAILLDSMTSGANNIVNYSMHPHFNELFGFTKDEIIWMMNELGITENKDELLDDLEEKYNGYLFSKMGIGIRVFNSNLVNYYLTDYLETGEPPITTRGTNILTDDKKIVSMLNLYPNVEDREQILMDIVSNKKIEVSYIDSFDLDGELDDEQFKHLLYYLGVLTIDSRIDNGYLLRVPNKVTEQVFYDTLKRYVAKQYQLDSSFYKKTKQAIASFMKTEDLTALNNIFQSQFTTFPKEVFSNFYEISLQVGYYFAFMGYSDIEVKVEDWSTKLDDYQNFGSGRTDITIISKNRADIIEFKYLSATKYKENSDLIDAQKEDGIQQLNDYAKGYAMHSDKKINKHLIMYVSGVCKLYEKLD